MPTERQARYIFALLTKAGYSTKWMNSSFKNLGASMRERSGKVEDWVNQLNPGEASKVIDRLKGEVDG